MTLLSDICDPDAVTQAIADGYIAVRWHRDGNLRILNYTAAAQYDQHWTPETIACRGLIVDDTDTVVARPFPKFFNWNQPEAPRLAGDYTIHTKTDGSLGIIYPAPDGRLAVATRGSFESDQALHATEVLRARYPNLTVPDNHTICVEIIYPDNRIVVDYNDLDDLIALAALDTHTGADVPLPESWTGPTVETHTPFGTIADLVSRMEEDDTAEAEGFVLVGAGDGTRPNPRIKVKYNEYLRVHLIVTNITAVDVWLHAAVEAILAATDVDTTRIPWMLRNDPTEIEAIIATGQPIVALMDRLPDEYHDWARTQLALLTETTSGFLTRHQDLWDSIDHPDDRKELAAAVKAAGLGRDDIDISVLFDLADGRAAGPVGKAWRAAKPDWRRVPISELTQPDPAGDATTMKEAI